MTRPFSLLIKPASADCNLRCQYCFYLEHASFYPETKVHRMSEKTLEHMIRSYMATKQPSYQFGWQGGEPTLMGVEFFQRVVELQQKHGREGVSVANGLQTNGVLITDEFAAHLAKYHFLTGVSLDGPRHLHDKYRHKLGGGGSHADVMRGIGRLENKHAEFNILTLVNEVNVKEPTVVYNYLCDHDFLFHQYIACVEPDENRHVLPFSTTGMEWGEFLCQIFDIWYRHDTRRVSIRLFDSVLALLVDGVRNICPFGSNCCQYFVVEYSGDVFPCDFFVEKRLHLGNVAVDSWETMQESPVYTTFGQQKSVHNSKCDACEFLWICQGDCLKHRLCTGGGSPERLSDLCPGWELFYQHAMPRFRLLAEAVKKDRRRHAFDQHMQSAGGRAPGRNDSCPCGSGKKFKKCCGRA
ncbi:MAG: anaerobic sulfatase maturase [Lentisphaeria bacterium]|nr:anaerobic sulfatase maturase [Lentisphaeria bacterium]